MEKKPHIKNYGNGSGIRIKAEAKAKAKFLNIYIHLNNVLNYVPNLSDR